MVPNPGGKRGEDGMRHQVAALITVAALLGGCATPAGSPTSIATAVEVAVEPTVTSPSTSTPLPSATPTIAPANEACVRASTEIPEGQNATVFVTSGAATGCYEGLNDFLGDIGLSWEEFAPGTVITFWTQWPVDARGSVVYPTPTPTPVPPTPTSVPPPNLAPGQMVFRQADRTIAYNWFTYVPASITKEEPSYVWVTGLHGNIITDEYNLITEESRQQAQWRTLLAEEHRHFLLVPAIPRPETNHVYAVGFDWKVFLQSSDPFCQRPDFKVNQMIDQFTADLRDLGYNVQDRVFIDGFSAGGMFGQRYTLLHPERVQAVAAGHCGGELTLAEASYDGTVMDWPVGINDFHTLVGREFNRDAYREVPQLVFIGDEDTNTTLWGTGELWRTQSQIDFLIGTFGATPPVRLENQVKYLNNLGYSSIVFKIYPGVTHQYTSEMVADALAFFDAHRQ
jgi:pimeloyl-ACP methyl ester carboxylesterase